MEDNNSIGNLPFFDQTPGTTPEERASVGKAVEQAEAEKKKKKVRGQRRGKRIRHRKRKGEKIQGVWILPVYQMTYNCMRECMFRFRRLPKEEREKSQLHLAQLPSGSAFMRHEHGMEAVSILRRVLVEISLVYWQVKPKTTLPDVFSLMLEAVVTIRALRDMGLLPVHDYNCICRYSGPMVKHMMGWSRHYNKESEIPQDIGDTIENASSPVADRAGDSLLKEA